MINVMRDNCAAQWYSTLMKSTESCVHCGTAPVNHSAHWLDASLTIVVTTVLSPLLPLVPSAVSLERSALIRAALRATTALTVFLGIIRFRDAIEGAGARTQMMWDEAKRRGIKIQQAEIFGRPSEYCRALLPIAPEAEKKEWMLFESMPVPPWINARNPHSIDDKLSFKKVFTAANLPVAEGRAALTYRAALRAFRSIGAPLVVKPREGSRARHTSVHISSEQQLRSAYDIAKQLCPVVMVEKFIPGILYRATCVGGKLVGVVQFVRPSVIADGVQTIMELLNYHNNHKRFANLTDVKDDWWFREAIVHQGYSVDDVPPKGAVITLSEHSERPNGGYFIDVTDSIPESHRRTIESGASVANIPVIGFDIISEDLTEGDKTFTFIEGNALPFIELHHIPYEGTPRNAAAAVWDLWQQPSHS